MRFDTLYPEHAEETDSLFKKYNLTPRADIPKDATVGLQRTATLLWYVEDGAVYSGADR